MTDKRRHNQRKIDDDPIGLDSELDMPLNTPAPMPSSPKYKDKKQDNFRRLSSKLQFTSSLYIDEAVTNLRKNVQKANNNKSLLFIKCDLIRIDPDRVRFHLESDHMGTTILIMKGTLQRWQGSRTRVDVNIRDEKRSRISKVVGIVYACALVIGAFTLPFAYYSSNNEPWFIILLGVMLLLFYVIPNLSHNDKPVEITQYELDVLGFILLDTFHHHDIKWLSKRRIIDTRRPPNDFSDKSKLGQ